MATIFVYNNETNKIERFNRGDNESMPYIINRTLKVKEFRGSSKSNILWTDKMTMETWNSFRSLYGRPIFVGFAFKRPYEGGHGLLSQHYAGLAFDVAQNLNESQRNYMRDLAKRSGLWNYVEPAQDTPRWVHFDNRWVPYGYPLTKYGSRGNYVFIAQDSLNRLGFNTGGLDGIFGVKTRDAVYSYQERSGLTVDGIIGNNTWNTLMKEVVGMG